MAHRHLTYTGVIPLESDKAAHKHDGGGKLGSLAYITPVAGTGTSQTYQLSNSAAATIYGRAVLCFVVSAVLSGDFISTAA